ERLEGEVGALGEEPRDRRLAAAGRPPEDHRCQGTPRDHAADRPLGAEQVVLADDVGDPVRPQPVGERVRRLAGEESGHAAHAGVAANTASKVVRNAWSTSAIVAVTPSAFSEVTPCPAMPHGTMPA